MLNVTNATIHAVCVERLIVGVLNTQLIAEHTSRSAAVDALCLSINIVFQNRILLNVFCQSGAVHTLHRGVNQTTLCQFAQQIQHTTCTTTLLHRILLRVWSQLAEERSLARELVDVSHREVNTSFLSHSQEVQHGIGGSTHRNVKGHRVEESLTSGNRTWKNRLITILIISEGILHNLTGSSLHQLLTIHVSSKDSTVTWQ